MLAVAWILSLLFRRVSRFIHDLQQIAIHANWLAILSKFYEFCQINQFGEIEKLQKWFRIRQIIQQWNQLSSDSIPNSFIYSVSVYSGTSTCTPNWGVDWGAKVRIKYRGGLNFRGEFCFCCCICLNMPENFSQPPGNGISAQTRPVRVKEWRAFHKASLLRFGRGLNVQSWFNCKISNSLNYDINRRKGLTNSLIFKPPSLCIHSWSSQK